MALSLQILTILITIGPSGTHSRSSNCPTKPPVFEGGWRFRTRHTYEKQNLTGSVVRQEGGVTGLLRLARPIPNNYNQPLRSVTRRASVRNPMVQSPPRNRQGPAISGFRGHTTPPKDRVDRIDITRHPNHPRWSSKRNAAEKNTQTRGAAPRNLPTSPTHGRSLLD